MTFETGRLRALESIAFKRMAQRGIDDPARYVSLLRDEEEEALKFLTLLTVKETYFFREPAHIEMIAEHLAPKMAMQRKPVKILSAGCATGEEPYSLAMELMERFGTGIGAMLSVTGVDIDPEALDSARKGTFWGRSFRGFDEALRKKYFKPAGNGHFEINDTLKAAVQFKQLNLLSETYPEELKGMDVVFYRNVSIYFDAATQRAIFKKLSDLLNDGGCLFLSSTETFSHDLGILRLQEESGQFFYRKANLPATPEPKTRRKPSGGGAKLEIRGGESDERLHAAAPGVASFARHKQAPVDQVSERPKARKKPSSTGKSQEELLKEALSLARAGSYDDAQRAIDEVLAKDPVNVSARSLKANLLINRHQTDPAREICLKLIEEDPWHFQSHLILGMAARLGDDMQGAVRKLRDALYIRPASWLAHYYLADAYQCLGQSDAACREYSLVINILGKGELAGGGLDVFALSVSPEQLKHLCRHNMEKISQRQATT